MVDVIVALVLIILMCGAVYYIYRKKKSGTKCIGCPYSESCQKKCPPESDGDGEKKG